MIAKLEREKYDLEEEQEGHEIESGKASRKRIRGN
jgi:hypothetical protein